MYLKWPSGIVTKHFNGGKHLNLMEEKDSLMLREGKGIWIKSREIKRILLRVSFTIIRTTVFFYLKFDIAILFFYTWIIFIRIICSLDTPNVNLELVLVDTRKSERPLHIK